MKEIRIKIYDNIPYDIVFNTIRDLLFDDIGKEDTFKRWKCSHPSLDFEYMIFYKKSATKVFIAWKIQ